MVYIHFIVNPISGNGNHNIGKTELEKYFSKEKFKIEVDYSNHKKHAITLTKKAIENNPNCIVACGGFAGKVKKLYTEDVANIYRMAK